MIYCLLFAAILALVLQSLLSGKSLDGIRADHRPETRLVEPEEPFGIQLTITNQTRRIVPFLRIREHLEKGILPLSGAGEVSRDIRDGHYLTFTAWLRPRQVQTRRFPAVIGARGRYLLRDLKLYGGDFLGLHEQVMPSGSICEIVAAPKALPDTALEETFGGFMGEVSVNRFILEDPVLTLGYREYTGREPMKMISWAQSARGSGLMVKKYDYTLEPSVSVLVNMDTDAPEKGPLLEKTYCLARTVCGLLEDRGTKYDFMTNAILVGELSELGIAGEGLGHQHFTGILEQLGRASYTPAFSFERMVSQQLGSRIQAAGRILITPRREARLESSVARLRELSGGSLLVLYAEEVAG